MSRHTGDFLDPARVARGGSVVEVFAAFLRLGLTSFGGPVAHLGYFRHEFVERRKWLDEAGYADLVALCQFLPGPASSQVGMSIGLLRAGLPGALAAWIAFTAPSAIALVLFAYGASALDGPVAAGVLHALKIITVAVVAQAVWSMGRAICTDRARFTIALLSAGILLAWPGAAMQVLVIAAAALGGAILLRSATGDPAGSLAIRVPAGMAAVAAVLFLALLLLLPLAAAATHSSAVAMFDTFYRAGALVFGGGHVVLPLLQSEVIPHGWVDNETFLAGYGAAQAVPGPLFTFAAYLGAASGVSPNGWSGALLCLAAIFLPSLLLVLAALPYWQKLRRQPSARAALAGANASVVGLLLAALYQPVWVSAIGGALDFAMALGAFLLLVVWRWSPLWVVLAAIAAGALHGTLA